MSNMKKEEFLYFINYTVMEQELCTMEMKYYFNKDINSKIFYSNIDVDPSKSPYIKCKIKVLHIAESIEEITSFIKENRISYDDFKVVYIKSEHNDVDYEGRLDAVRKIGYVIKGYPDIHNPKILISILKIHDKWILGEYYKNNQEFLKHNNKPYSYSNALGIKIARSLVNIAMINNENGTLVDPCCGVGTVVIEALDLGINIKGYEISKQMAYNARENIEFLGYPRDTIICGNMHDIKECYDTAIVDIPYGLFSPITLKEQIDIIKTARRICRKMVIVTFENMEEYIKEAGFTIIDKCVVPKGNFKRYIFICI